jgi:hypothetical protein
MRTHRRVVAQWRLGTQKSGPVIGGRGDGGDLGLGVGLAEEVGEEVLMGKKYCGGRSINGEEVLWGKKYILINVCIVINSTIKNGSLG